MASGILEVTLVDAEDLREINLPWYLSCFAPCFDGRKPYVMLQYGSQKHISCVAQEDGKKHIWDEKFKFDVEYEGEKDHINTKLVLHVMDKHLFSSDKVVGDTTVYVKDVVLLGMDEGNVDIEPQKYRVVRSDKSYSGEISVALTFTKAANYENEEDLKSVKLNDDICEN